MTSDRDQESAEADQRASDRDQEAADEDLAADADSTPAERQEYERTRSTRDKGTLDRRDTAVVRADVSRERDAEAYRRDEVGGERDRIADTRDRVAEQHDRVAEELASEVGDENAATPGEPGTAAAARTRAAEDRRRAADDRHRAAQDREKAASDREAHEAELEHAHMDELTGAYGRAMGEVTLRHELERVERTGDVIVLAYFDFDGLEAINDRQGHAAGDALLLDGVNAIRSQLRPYDPIVRWGGDEFVCVFPGLNPEEVERRLVATREVLAEHQPEASFTVGLALRTERDTLATLMERADQALVDARRVR